MGADKVYEREKSRDGHIDSNERKWRSSPTEDTNGSLELNQDPARFRSRRREAFDLFYLQKRLSDASKTPVGEKATGRDMQERKEGQDACAPKGKRRYIEVCVGLRATSARRD